MGFLNSLSLSWETFWRMILHSPHSWHNCFVCKPQAYGLLCKYLGYHTAPDTMTSVFVEPLQLLAGSELHPSKPSMSFVHGGVKQVKMLAVPIGGGCRAVKWGQARLSQQQWSNKVDCDCLKGLSQEADQGTWAAELQQTWCFFQSGGVKKK